MGELITPDSEPNMNLHPDEWVEWFDKRLGGPMPSKPIRMEDINRSPIYGHMTAPKKEYPFPKVRARVPREPQTGTRRKQLGLVD